MSSLMGSQGMALATAMAVSGTVILFAVCRPRPATAAGTTRLAAATVGGHQKSVPKKFNLRPCISSGSDARKREEETKKKRVHFAEDVVPEFDAEEDMLVRLGQGNCDGHEDGDEDDDVHDGVRVPNPKPKPKPKPKPMPMPANRVALYNGILRDRTQRIACSY